MGGRQQKVWIASFVEPETPKRGAGFFLNSTALLIAQPRVLALACHLRFVAKGGARDRTVDRTDRDEDRVCDLTFDLKHIRKV